MQAEIAEDFPDLPVHILAINAAGLESGNDDVAAVGTLPLLQDTTSDGVWHDWAADWRDVYVLDGDNVKIHEVNLTGHSLADGANYAELLTVLVEAASDLD